MQLLRQRGVAVRALCRHPERAADLRAQPLHPGLARLLSLTSLPDDAIDETWNGCAALERELGIRMTRLEDFVRARVAAAGIRPAA